MMEPPKFTKHPHDSRFYIVDSGAGTFTKICQYEHRDFPSEPKLVAKYLETPRGDDMQNSLKEYLALEKLQVLLDKNISDGVPRLLGWHCTPTQSTLTIEMAQFGTLADYFSVRDPEEFKNFLHSTTPGPVDQKMSILIRCLVVLSLFAQLNIAHNDINGYNIVLTTCSYDYAEIKYGTSTECKMLVPTFGVRPMIVDFGQATTYAKTTRGYDDTLFLLLEFISCDPFRAPDANGYVVRTPRKEILGCALYYYQLLQQELAQKNNITEKAIGTANDASAGDSTADGAAASLPSNTRCFDISNVPAVLAAAQAGVREAAAVEAADVAGGCKCVIS